MHAINRSNPNPPLTWLIDTLLAEWADAVIDRERDRFNALTEKYTKAIIEAEQAGRKKEPYANLPRSER